MNKLELILYLKSLLDRCNNIEEIYTKLVDDEINERADIKIREQEAKDLRDHELNEQYKSNQQELYDHFEDKL